MGFHGAGLIGSWQVEQLPPGVILQIVPGKATGEGWRRGESPTWADVL